MSDDGRRSRASRDDAEGKPGLPTSHILGDSETLGHTIVEDALQDRKRWLFGGSMEELQIALALLQQLRELLLGKAKGFFVAFQHFDRNRDDLIDTNEFILGCREHKFSILDSERMFRLIDDGKAGAINFPEFMTCMRNAAPVCTLGQLRTRLVQRYRSLDVAFQDMPEHAVYIDEFEKVCVEWWVAAKEAKQLFRMIDRHGNGHITWKGLRFALDHAHAFSVLLAVKASFLKEHASVSQAVDALCEADLGWAVPPEETHFLQVRSRACGANARHCTQAIGLKHIIYVRAALYAVGRSHIAENLSSLCSALAKRSSIDCN